MSKRKAEEKKEEEKKDEVPLIRSHTQMNTLKEAEDILENMGGRPTTKLRENPKQIGDNKEAQEEEEEEKKVGRKKTSKNYMQLTCEAIDKLGRKEGSSFVSICRYIENNYDVPSSFQTHVRKNLKKAIEEGAIVLNKRSYKLSGKNKPSSRSPSPKRKSKSPSPKRDKKKSDKKEKSRSPSPSKKKSSSSSEGSRKKKTATSSPTSSSPSSSKKRKTDTSSSGSVSAVPTLKRAASTTIKAGPRLKGVASNGIEIIFSFDTTGSMCAYLNEVKAKLGEMVTELVHDIQDIKIGIIAHGDYCDEQVFYLLKKHEFSNDSNALAQWIKTVGETGGGDVPEAYELVLQEAQKFNWSDNCERVLVVIGDAYPHGPNECRKIDWRAELKALVQMDVRVYGVQVGDDSTSSKFFQEISEESYGTHLKMQEFQQLKEMMIGLCYREAAEGQFQKHFEEINNMEKTDSAKLMLPEGEEDNKDKLSNEEILKIHNAIHDSEVSEVEVKGVSHKIAVGKAGCRFVRLADEGLTFIEQNKEKDNKYARMAIEGKAITWIVKKGRWGLVIDQSVENN